MSKAIGIEAENAGRYVRIGFGPGEVCQPCERAVCNNQQLGKMYTVSDIWTPLVHEVTPTTTTTTTTTTTCHLTSLVTAIMMLGIP